MTTRKNLPKAWFCIVSDMRKDAPFFGIVGFICGVIQFIGYRYFDKSNFGANLLQEHIAFNSLLLMLMFLLVAKGITLWLSHKKELPRTDALIRHVSGRAIAFGSVAASVTIGFAFAAAVFHSYAHALKFTQAGLYFAAIAEVAANPLRPSELSKGYVLALGMLIVTPFTY